jgi:N-acetyl-anhydromuramyl-L-alanine amidase AmpD
MLTALLEMVRRATVAIEQDQDERHDDAAPATVADLDIRDGWLEGRGVTRDTSPKHSRSPRLERQGPDLVVTHCTSTLHGTAPALLKAIRGTGGREASWHVLIDERGGIFQSISFTRAAWHAGSASAARVDLGGALTAVNACSVGIELINAGEVRKVGAEYRAWPFAGDKERKPGPVVPLTQTVDVGRRIYHAYTPAQYEAWRRVMRALVDAYPQIGGEVAIVARDGKRRQLSASRVGHVDIDPSRKADPHPHWVWPAPRS